MKPRHLLLAVVASAVLMGGMTYAAHHMKDKHAVEDIMKKGMKGKTSLLSKITGGKASKDEAKLFHEYMLALAEFKPKKGSEQSWKQKTAALVSASKAVAAGNRKAVAVLKKASDCKACHNEHKGD